MARFDPKNLAGWSVATVPRPIVTEHSKRPLTTAGAQTTKKVSVERQHEFDNIVSQALPRLRRIAMRWLRNPEDAEDAVQDAMLSAFSHIEQFDGRAQMSSWLTTILINAVRMQLRRRDRLPMLLLDETQTEDRCTRKELLVDSRLTPEQDMERRELNEFVIKLTSRLPASQRITLHLRVWHELNIQSVASVLGVPVGTVKARLTRSKAELRRRFRHLLCEYQPKRSRAATSTCHLLPDCRRDRAQFGRHVRKRAFGEGGSRVELAAANSLSVASTQSGKNHLKFLGSRRGGSSVPA